MNSDQAKALTNLVKYNFVPILHTINNEYVFVSFQCLDDDTWINRLCELCKPCVSSFCFDGNRVSGYIYRRELFHGE